MIFFLFITACSDQSIPVTQTTDEKKMTSLTILALGDSLTEGLAVEKNKNYPALLEQKLSANGFGHYKVINSGLSGETSSGLKARIDWVLQTKPTITILTIGANDAMRGIPINIVEQNISSIIEQLQTNGSQVILSGMEIYNNLGQDYVNSFRQIYPKLAKKYNIPLIPFFLAGVAGNNQLNQADGIHPTSAGYDIIVNDNIWPVLQPLLEQPNK